MYSAISDFRSDEEDKQFVILDDKEDVIEKVTTRKRPRQTQINVAKYSREEAVAVLNKKKTNN